MSGKAVYRGKGGKGGKYLGKGAKSRPGWVEKDNWEGVTYAAIRKLCHRGGVVRISHDVYQENRDLLKAFLEKIMADAWTYARHARRSTVQGIDVLFALKRHGHVLLTGGEKKKKKAATLSGPLAGP